MRIVSVGDCGSIEEARGKVKNTSQLTKIVPRRTI